LYPTLSQKVAALGFSLISNHPFVDGNNRIGHAAMKVFLLLKGYEFSGDTDEQERIILQIASGSLSRETLAEWVEHRLVPRIEAT
jgi:death-on-curing protein